jgi:hypothetical protein
MVATRLDGTVLNTGTTVPLLTSEQLLLFCCGVAVHDGQNIINVAIDFCPPPRPHPK